MSHQEKVRNRIRKHHPHQIIEAGRLHRESLSDVPETAYYKTLERMVRAGELFRLSKGVYCVPKSTIYGRVDFDENEVHRHFVGRSGNRGVIVGYSLYNKYGLSTQIAKTTLIYTNALASDKKTIGAIRLQRLPLEPSESIRNAIESLEILQHVGEIEDLRFGAFRRYLDRIPQTYNDAATRKVLRTMRYKKRTIAYLSMVLDHFHVPHRLGEYLSGTSDYNLPTWDEIDGTAS